MGGDRVLRQAPLAHAAPAPARCPRCQGPLYDPQDEGLRAECLFCGYVAYTPDRGELRRAGGLGGRRGR
jgi:hypothetical protein